MAFNLPPGPTPGSLREKIEWMLQRPFVLVYETIIEPIGDRLRAGVDNLLEQMEQALLSYSRPWIARIADAPGLPEEIKDILDRANNPQGQVEIAAVIAVVAGILIGIIQGAMGPISRFMSYFVERIVQTGRPDPESLFRMHRRGALDADQRDSYLDDLGVSDRLKDAFGTISEVRPGLGELITLWLRGHLDTAAFHGRLSEEGVPSLLFPDIEKLAVALASPVDLVRFALREVWRPELRPELLSPDAPDKYYSLMAQQGFDHDSAADYWAAHWELPSVGMGFQMYHRLESFTEADLRALLTRLDILPRYHDQLIAIAYNTYTRVDARRMYAAGVLSAEEVLQSYLNQGYDAEKARKLADFAIADAGAADRELTKSDILNGYRDGLLSLAEARDMLIGIRYSTEAAIYLLARIDAQQAQKLVDAETDIFRDLFVNNDLSLVEAQSELATLGLQARQIELLIAEWTIDREGKVKRPTRATLERLYKTGTITQEEFVSTLDAIGYQDKYIDWYLTNIALERQTEAEKEEERARKERERVEKDKRRTAYQRDKAELDVEIAEVNAAIAAADVALAEATHERNEALRAALPLEERATIERDYMLIAHDADNAIGQARIVVAGLRAEDKALRSLLAVLDQSLATNIDVALQEEIKANIASMRVAQARFTDAAAAIVVEIARLKETGATETDPVVLEQMALDLLALQVREKEERQAITSVGIDISSAMESLGATMGAEHRADLETEQAVVRVRLADISERIATAQSAMAETAKAKLTAKNAMDAELTELPGAVQELEILQHYNSLIERIRAQVKELRVRLSQLRVQKALLTFEYAGPSG